MTKTELFELSERRLRSHLKRRGMRNTSERLTILRAATELDAHFTSLELHGTLEKRGYHVSLSTVYYSLALFCECGILRKNNIGTSARYEFAQATHVHLVCTICGAISEIEADNLVDMLGAMRGDFKPQYITANVYGRCRACSRRPRRNGARRTKKQ